MRDCHHCENIISSTNLGKFTAHCNQVMKLFCSASCLEEQMNEETVSCLMCNTPGQGYFEVQGDKGLVKYFATKKCVEEYAKLKGSKNGEKRAVLDLGASSDKPKEGSLQTSKCDFCDCDFVSETIYSSDYQFQVKVFCSSKCQYYFRIENSKFVCCVWCKALKPECSMIFRQNG